MPEQEFEIYLSLLSRLLRLSSTQKAAISDELRDHLEERLTELLESGLSREAAIKTAMDEFGDVTGLALDLTKVSRTPIRKVVFRSTIAASAVAVFIVGWVTMFVPEHRIGSLPVVQAQQEKTQSSGTEPAAAESKPLTLAIDDAELFPTLLTEQGDISISNMPLDEACKALESTFDVPIVVRRVVATDGGIANDTPVDLTLNGLTLEEVLNHLTKQLGLTWEVDDGMVQITTPDAAAMVNRHYDLQNLTKAGHTPVAILGLVRQASNKWMYDDGEGGTLAIIGGSLVVRQTFRDQRNVALILAAAERQQPMVYLETCTGKQRLVSVLRESASVEATDAPLGEVLNSLSDQHQIPILIDQKALEDAGVSTDTPVTFSMKSRSFGKLLDLMLADAISDGVKLTHLIRDGVVWVTTTDAAMEEMTMVAYDLRDVVPPEEDYPNFWMMFTNAMINATSGKWEEKDGEGGRFARSGSFFVVKQSDRVQSEIQTMIAQLRRTPKSLIIDAEKLPPQGKMVTKYYWFNGEVTSDLTGSVQNFVAPQSWMMRNDEINPTIERISINPLRSALVVRQTPQVHGEIQKFLRNLGVPVQVASPQDANAMNFQGGMGGGEMGSGGGMMGGGMGGGGFF